VTARRQKGEVRSADAAQGTSSGEDVVRRQRGRVTQLLGAVALIEREKEIQRGDQSGRVSQQPIALGHGRPSQADLALREISQAAVHKLRRAARRARREIASLEEHRAYA